MPKSICLAPGHGGFDPGCVGNGLKEKDINLAVCLDLQRILEAAGIHVVMTRTTDEAAGGAKTVQEDLYNQCKIANDAKVDIYFSVHVNAGGGHGAEAYANPRNAAGVQLAKACVDAIADIMGVHGEPVKDGMGLYVIHHTQMTAILLEIGFIDSTDAQKIKDHLHEFAPRLAKVLVPWLGGKMPETLPQPQKTAVVDDDSQYVTHQELAAALQKLKAELEAEFKAQQQPAQSPAQPSRQVVAQIQVDVANDAMYFDLPVDVPDHPDVKTVGKFIWDTGAFELTVSKAVADALGLPNLGSVQIGGIGGTVEAYTSKLPVKLGDTVYQMDCVVDPSWNDMTGAVGLFGLRGMLDNHLDFDVDLDAKVITIYRKAG